MQQYTYFEVADLSVNPDGTHCPAGLMVNMVFDDPQKAIATVAEFTGFEASRISIISEEKYMAEYADENEDRVFDEDDENNILLVKSGKPRTELQQAYDYIAVLEAKIENLEQQLQEAQDD